MPIDRNEPTDAPARLEIGAGAHRRSVGRADGLYARHGLRKDATAREDAALDDAVLTLDDGAIAVFRAGRGKPATAADTRIGPVYELQPGGSLAVPTGRVFIRFADSVNAESRREEMRGAGYEIVRLLGYAPNAAWLEARSGEIGDALRRIEGLRGLNDVEQIEPELQMERHHRE